MPKPLKATAKFFSKLNQKIRKTSFGNRIVQVYEGPGSGGVRAPSPVAHPFDFYDSLKWGKKNTTNGKSPHPLGTTVRMRIIDGPELNILMLGVPFVLDFAVSEATKAVRKAKAKKQAKQAKNQPIHLTAKPAYVSKFKKVNVAPLPSAPFSDEAHKNVYLALINLGMSVEGAKMVASGDYEGLDASDYLDEADLDILGEFLTSDDFVNYDLTDMS